MSLEPHALLLCLFHCSIKDSSRLKSKDKKMRKSKTMSDFQLHSLKTKLGLCIAKQNLNKIKTELNSQDKAKLN